MKDFCAGKVAEVRCAVLYEKPRSTVNCEYVWRRTDRWIDFPWSAEAPVGRPLLVPPADAVAIVGSLTGASRRGAHEQEEARARRARC